jgi:Cthe_2314-like HEPN
MGTQETIASHPLIVSALDVVKPLLIRGTEAAKETVKRKREALQEANRKTLSPLESYSLSVMEAIHPFVGVFDRIDQAHSLIFRFPSVLRNGRHKMSRDQWVDYHFGTLTVSFASVLDVHLILVARIYQLGLPSRQCKFELLADHLHISSAVKKQLKELKKSLQPHIERRHSFVHRGERADIGVLTDPEILDLVRTLGFLGRVNPHDTIVSELPLLWRAAIRNLKPKLSTTINSLVKASSSVLDSMLPVWHDRQEALARLSR